MPEVAGRPKILQGGREVRLKGPIITCQKKTLLADGRALLDQTLQDQLEIRAQKLAEIIAERRGRSLELIMGYCAK